MADLGSLVAAALFLSFALYRALIIWRGSDPAQRYIAGFAGCMGAAMLFRAPVVMSALRDLAPLDTVVMLVTHELKSFAHVLLLLVGLSLRPAGPDRGAQRRQLRLAAAVLVTGAAVLLMAGVRAESGLATAPPDRRWFLAVYNVLFAAYGTWCLLVLTRELVRQTRQVAAGPMRTGLRLMTFAALLGIVWTLWVLTYVPMNLTQGLHTASEDAVCSVLGAVTAALATGGATATWWASASGGPLAAPGRWLSAYRRHRALEPLWSALRTELPQIALDPAAPRRPVLWRAEFDLYRRVIEIRDGHLALRPYFPADATGRAAPDGTDGTVVGPAGPVGPVGPGDRSAEVRAVVEAATIAAALEGKRAGRAPAGVHSSSPVSQQIAGTVAAEVAWLLLVTAAFVSSPEVAAARVRARTDATGLQDGPRSR
ncbi:MAB_1171c family putative transporter [Streptomyces sp. NPDC047070]|uniref:MAB_1171c family putative transporter n=1 Tax=Streptomyces sp. NPDC047070 TaxID=3154923 RepID=UPI00345184C1